MYFISISLLKISKIILIGYENQTSFYHVSEISFKHNLYNFNLFSMSNPIKKLDFIHKFFCFIITNLFDDVLSRFIALYIIDVMF